jgi:hypothetical protein
MGKFSHGRLRVFKITWGLRAGSGPSGRLYDLEEAIRAAHGWMRERDAPCCAISLGHVHRSVKLFMQVLNPAALMIASPSPSLPVKFCPFMLPISMTTGRAYC